MHIGIEMSPEAVSAANQLATDGQSVRFEMNYDDLDLGSCDECSL